MRVASAPDSRICGSRSIVIRGLSHDDGKKHSTDRRPGRFWKLMEQEKNGPLEQLEFVTEMLRILPGDTLKSKGISCFDFAERVAFGATAAADQEFWVRRFRETSENLDKKFALEQSTRDEKT